MTLRSTRSKRSAGIIRSESWWHIPRSGLGPSRGVSPVLAPANIRVAILAILLRGVSSGDNYVATALTDRENSRHVTLGEFDSVFRRVFGRRQEPKFEQVLSALTACRRFCWTSC